VIRRAFGAGVVLALAVAAPASAHIQVRPALVAPGDPVMFQLVVPGERDDAQTVGVTLQMPAGMIPFAWQDTPGWTRTEKLKADQSLDTVTWKGKLAKDGFVTFSFLAGTPDKEGDIAWRTLQTYSDGQTVRWIGAPGSDNPAAVTKIAKDAPRENAGGEGASSPAASPTASAAPTVAVAAITDPPADDDKDSPLPLILSIAALALAAVALLGSRRRT
jgi:MYXO-CTERM domain-containing protein